MRYDAAAPDWPDRDRFVLSAGHASILLYSMLHLTGYGLTLDDLRDFRQWGSATPGHPEVHHTAGVEVTTGPLGQGFANGVGHRRRRAWLRARFGADAVRSPHLRDLLGRRPHGGHQPRGRLLAGHLRLGRLVYVYDDNHITIDGDTELSSPTTPPSGSRPTAGTSTTSARSPTTPTRSRPRCAGRWRRRGPPVAARPAQPHRLARPPSSPTPPRPTAPARRRRDRGHEGDPRPAARRDVLGARRRRSTVPHGRAPGPRAARGVGKRLRRLRRRPRGLRGRASAGGACPAGRTPCRRGSRAPRWPPGRRAAPCLEALVDGVPGPDGRRRRPHRQHRHGHQGRRRVLRRRSPTGRQIYFGVREHGMGGVMNGMAPHGGVLPVGGTFFVFSDYMRPAVRLAAMSRVQGRLLLHPRLGRPRRGRPHPPAHRAPRRRCGPCPSSALVRPADANETAAAWRVALDVRRPHRPRPHPPERARARRHRRPARSSRGAYVLADPTATPIWCSSAPAARCRCASTRRPCWPPTAVGPGRVDAVVGPVRCAERRVPGRASCPPEVPTARRRGRRQPGLGPLGRRQRRPRPLRRLGARRHRARQPRVHARQRGRARPPARSNDLKEDAVSKLHDLYDEQGQSPWLDNLRRGWLTGGELARWVERGRPGHHLQPDDLPEGDRRLRRVRRPVRRARRRRRVDRGRLLGRSSAPTSRTRCASCARSTTPAAAPTASCRVEVAPALARDTRRHRRRGPRRCTTASPSPTCSSRSRPRPRASPAIRTMIGEGRSINVTLIFGLDRYDEVMEAYIVGPRGATTANCPRSPASPRSSSAGSTPRSTSASRRSAPTPPSPCGARRRWPRRSWPTAASSTPSAGRAGRRSRRGAPRCSGRCGRRRRPRTPTTSTPSTSTRSSAPTRSTPCPRPPSRRSTTTAPWPAPSTPTRRRPRRCSTPSPRSGVDLDDVGRVLEEQGVASFAKSFDELIAALEAKADELR